MGLPADGEGACSSTGQQTRDRARESRIPSAGGFGDEAAGCHRDPVGRLLQRGDAACDAVSPRSGLAAPLLQAWVALACAFASSTQPCSTPENSHQSLGD